MRKMRGAAAVLLLFVLSLLASCGDDRGGGGSSPLDKFTGVYEVKTHLTTRDCEAPESEWEEGTRVGEVFRLKTERFVGETLLCQIECEAPESCPDECNLFSVFVPQGEDALMEFEAWSAAGGTCQVTRGDNVMSETEAGVEMTIERLNTEISAESQEDCEQKKEGLPDDEFSCDSRERLIAEELEPE